jgi:hypothetical protein
LVESSLPINILLNVLQDPILIQINSSRDVVVEDYIRIPSRPFVESGVDDALFQSESFRTLVHTSRIFNPSPVPVRSFWRTSSRHDIFDKLGMSPNQPMSSHTPITYTTYTISLDHFTDMTSNFVTILDPLLVGTYTILPLQLTSSTSVPQVTHIFIGSTITNQTPFGMPLPLR